MTERRTVDWNINQEPLIDWTVDPRFHFATEIEALEAVATLGEELRVAREQVRHAMRYLTIAVQTARSGCENGDRVSKLALANNSGIARQTIYNMLED